MERIFVLPPLSEIDIESLSLPAPDEVWDFEDNDGCIGNIQWDYKKHPPDLPPGIEEEAPVNGEENVITFRKLFIELRKEMRLSQLKLSKELGIPRSTIAAWELGVRKPKADELCTISRFFNVTCDYLLGFAENKDEKHESPGHIDKDKRISI